MNTAKIIIGALLLVFSISFAVDVTTCGVISAPGTYDLASDLSTAGTSLPDCLVIASPDVQINGHGHSITAPNGYGIYINHNNVLVQDCTVTGSLVGIEAEQASNMRLERNTATGNGRGFALYSGQGSVLSKNSASGGEYGFYLSEAGNYALESNIAEANGVGFHLTTRSSNNRLTGNTARLNTANGFEIALDSDGNTLDSNVAEQNGYGFYVSGTTLPDGTELKPDGNTLTGNTANGNGAGMRLVDTGTGNVVSGSTVTDNLYGGIGATRSPDTEITSNTITNNGPDYGLASGILLKESPGYAVSGNSVSGSYHGIYVTESSGTIDNTVISGSTLPLQVYSAPGSVLTDVIIVNSGPVQLRGDSTGTSIQRLTLRDASQEVQFTVTPDYWGDFDLYLASAPAAAPSGYTPLGKYLAVDRLGTGAMPDNIDIILFYSASDTGSFSDISAMSFTGGSWANLAQGPANFVPLELGDVPSGVLALFGVNPTAPPVTPPSGGHTGGGGTGGTTHGGSGGAVHIGVPYVPSGTSGGEGFGGEATPPSCTSDDDCASSAACSAGVCTALEAGSSCGTFQNHEWVDFECCDTSECSAGEVCRDNACTPLEPLVITPSEGTTPVASDEGIGRLLADVPWWVLTLLLLMVGGGIYARYAMGREEPPEGEEGEEGLPPAGEEEE